LRLAHDREAEGVRIMPSSDLDRAKELLHTTSHYVPFCEAFSKAMDHDSEQTERWLFEEAIDLLSVERPTVPDLVALQKAVFGLNIHAAVSADSQGQQDVLDRAVLPLLERAVEATARDVVASELTYVDQYLNDSVRRSVRTAIRKHGVRNSTSSIADYLEAWDKQERLGALLDILGPPESKESIEVYFVCSTKGGVGKSVTALSLLHFLAEQTDGEDRVAIMDLDASGPTLQFTLDMTSVSNTHSLLPSYDTESDPKPTWRYWTLLDVLPLARRKQKKKMRAMAQKCIFPVRNLTRASAVLLPDSPTFTAAVSSYWNEEVERENVLFAISAVFDALATTNPRHTCVVLDCSPGLFGANGFLLQWVSQRFPTSLVVLSSPNASDIGTTLYETLWIAAAGAFRWRRTPLLLANKWPSDGKSLEKTLDTWTGKYVKASVDAALAGNTEATTSASQIYASRMWSYLYWRTLKPRSFLDLRQLREDTQIAHILDPPPDGPFSLNWPRVLGSSWYEDDLKPILTELTHRGDREGAA